MTTIYTSVSILSYNANPPADDGSNQPSNRINWSKHKEKLSDPIKTALESINTNISTAIGKLLDGADQISTGISYTVQASDQGRNIRCTTAGITLTTPDATSVTTPFLFGFVNASTGFITLDGNGTQEINGKRSLLIPPGGGGVIKSDGADWVTLGIEPDPPLPRGYLAGLALTRDTDTDHDISIAAGECRDSGHAINFRLTSAHVKRIDSTWASGTGNGGLASALTVANDTWYHVFLVDDGNGNIEAGFDTSTTAANLLSDTGGTLFRRIGSVKTDGSANILAFQQIGDRFLWTAPVFDYDNTPNTAATVTISTPLGVRVLALLNANVNRSSSSGLAYFPTISLQTEEAPNAAASPGVSIGLTANSAVTQFFIHQQIEVLTNTSSQIKVHTDNAATGVRITTFGWTDRRGRDA